MTTELASNPEIERKLNSKLSWLQSKGYCTIQESEIRLFEKLCQEQSITYTYTENYHYAGLPYTVTFQLG